jgi:hypothetical protein
LQATFENWRGKVLGKTAKIVSILVAIAMVLAVFVAIVPKSAAENTSMPKIVEPERMYIGSEYRDRSVDMASLNDAILKGPSGSNVHADFYDVGDTVDYLVDPYTEDDWLEFEKRGEGNHCEVWVATDLSFPEGDPRNDKVDITNAKVDYMIQQFDEVIFPIESDYFGLPNNHTGDNSVMEDAERPFFQSEDGQITMIMIFNIIDENYYDPEYRSYVVGYYSPTAEYLYDRNIIHIDCYDWVNRTTEFVPRPFVYEATVAHEYQHLLHDDADSDEDSWINEGCSMYSEFLCGYMVESEMWRGLWEFLYTPDNGLVDWGDQGNINILADYNCVLLFMMYMNDHFGGVDFITALFHNPDNGIFSVTSTLSALGYSDWTFEDVFHAWRLANLIHDDQPGNGLYNYISIDWESPYSMELYNSSGSGSFPIYDPDDGMVWGSDFGNTYNIDGDDTGIPYVGSYGTDYVMITDLWDEDEVGLKLFFEGWQEIPEGWHLAPRTDIEPTIEPIYTENFNHGGALPDGWETWSEGPDYLPWETYYWGGDDFSAVCWGWDPSEYIDITEWLYMDTISLDLSDMDSPALVMYMMYLVWNGDEYISVMVDAGSGWEEAASWDYGDGDIVGDKVIDLSPWAGEPNVRLGFKYHATDDYVVFIDDLQVYDVEFDYAWYTGRGDLKDWKLTFEADLTSGHNSTLEFDTFYAIEDYWDFGFVQVSTDDGETWTTLENEYTISEHDVNAHPAIVEQLPGLTGTSGDWMTMSFDLSDYDGMEVMICFRYMTDWLTTEEGWWIDNVKINGELVDNGEDVRGLVPDYAQTEWLVTIYVPAFGSMPGFVFDLNLNDMEQTLRSIHALAEFYPYFFMIASPTIGMADYMFGVFNTGGHE